MWLPLPNIFFTLQVLRPSHSIPSIKKKRVILRHLVLWWKQRVSWWWVLDMVLAVIRTYRKAVQLWGLKRTLEKMYSVRKGFYLMGVTVAVCGGPIVILLMLCC